VAATSGYEELVQELIGFVAPFFHFIITLFDASTAGSIPFILSSCLFITGLLWKNNSSLVSPKSVKEGVQTHVTELTSQAKLGPDMSVPAHARRLQQESDFSPQSPLKTDIKADVGQSKLITLKQAVATHGVAYETLRSWYRSGHLSVKGREIFHTHGGGKILVDEKDVLRLKTQPPARGKPPVKPKE
jgi:hypothetical protein